MIMKICCFLSLIALLMGETQATTSSKSDYFYYYRNTKMELKPDLSKEYIVFDAKKYSSADVKFRLGQLGVAGEIFEIAPGVMKFQLLEGKAGILQRLSSLSYLGAIYPSDYEAQNTHVSIDNMLICMPKAGVAVDKIVAFLVGCEAKVIDTYNFGPLGQAYLIAVDYSANVILQANRLHESGFVRFSEPNLASYTLHHESKVSQRPQSYKLVPGVPKPRPHIKSYSMDNGGRDDPYYPNDPLYTGFPPFGGQQWYINQISCPNAWGFGICWMLDPPIEIVVMHGGFDFTNADFYDGGNPNYTAGYNAIDGSENVGTTCGQDNVDDCEGTRVSGIICAATDNNYGMASVSFGTLKILPIKVVDVGTDKNGNCYDNYTKPSYVSNAVSYLQTRRRNDLIAAVSLTVNWASSDIIEAAILSMKTPGGPLGLRGGLGCVVVAASGDNGSNYLEFPALDTVCLSVGGTSISNGPERRWSGSNYDDAGGLDMVAPGDNITTTNVGNTPYNFYTGQGTSFSVPMVCATLGMMLCKNQSLNSYAL